ncbi:MAG: PKD domain-containing protein [Chloroflexota bacterium]
MESIVCNPVSGSASAPVVVTCGVTMNVNPASSEWDFGDPGAPGSSSSGAHSYASPGSYTISLTVTAAGGTDSATLLYVVQ